MNNIAIHGCLPPPIGGMSMHVKRLSALLSHKKIEYTIFCDKTGGTFIERIALTFKNLYNLCLNKKYNIHYIVSSNPIKRFVYVLLGIIFKKNVIIRIGGFSLERNLNGGGIMNYLEKFSLTYASKVLVVSDVIFNHAVKVVNPNKVFIIPGFIPPFYELKGYNTQDATNFYSSSKYKLLTTGQLTSNRHNNDIYGILSMPRLIRRLLDNVQDVKLIVVLYGIIEEELFSTFESEIQEQKVKENIKIIRQYDGGEIIPLLKISNVFIRNSFEDGDSNVLREALYYNNIAFASDCVNRPQECFHFQTGSNEDLVNTFLKYRDSPIKYTRFHEEQTNNINKLLDHLLIKIT